jgi:hypothetical protein
LPPESESEAGDPDIDLQPVLVGVHSDQVHANEPVFANFAVVRTIGITGDDLGIQNSRNYLK